MHIDTAALVSAIRRACIELARVDAAAAEGCIGRIDGRRVLLRIEPEREDWAGRELPLPPGAEGIVSDGEPAGAEDPARLLRGDAIDDTLDELAAVCAHWQRNREQGRPVDTLRRALLELVDESRRGGED
jgi:hypothetical protein